MLPLRFLLSAVCCSSFIQAAVPDDVELIPDELRTAGAENLGKSLSLGITSNTRHRRDRQEKSIQKAIDIDQLASGSELLTPGFDVGYSELGQYVRGDQHLGDRYFQRQDAGGARGEVGFYGNAGRQGSAGRLSDDAYVANHEASRADRADGGFYGNNAGLQQGHDVGSAYYGAQALNRKGAGAAALGTKGGYRKGHHSSGFHNTYHKDESGNNTSYYDEAVDDGGHFLYDARGGEFSEQGGNAQKGVFQDGAFVSDVKGNQGQYGAAQGFNDVRGQKGNYGRGEYYDNAQDYGNQRDNERYAKIANLGQAEGGAITYGNVGHGENYQNVLNKPLGVVAYPAAKHIPVVYEPYTNPVAGVVQTYPVQGRNYYRYPTYNYYPVGSYGPPSPDHYDKALYSEIKEPFHLEGQGKGYATFINSPSYIPHTSGVSEKYFGTYRGITY